MIPGVGWGWGVLSLDPAPPEKFLALTPLIMFWPKMGQFDKKMAFFEIF
jgi:hypothetical protein